MHTTHPEPQPASSGQLLSQRTAEAATTDHSGRGAADWRLDLPPSRWHRPLLALGILLAGLTVATAVGWLIDDRELLGVNLWEKPLKFAISGTIYAVTWAWIIGHFTRWQRVAWWAGTVIAITLAIELVVITGAAMAGITSHFNVSTPLATTLWSIMAAAITTLWVATFVAAAALWRNPGADPARQAAIRTGVAISLLGMGLAFLMTGPNAEQLNDFQGIAGAHAVGVADGGPGLPLLGWSTEGGDLRIPHFIGMHALQALPLLALLLELGARRLGVLRDWAVRRGLVLTGAGAYLAVVGLVTLQALRGQSIVAPDALTLAIAAAIAALALAASLGVLVAGSRRRASRTTHEQTL
ncbi:MAG: hypothetical protein KIT89_00540 [Microcella sp.]|uniref:hypothetical protein n=1 Tax=Microcella sp. TaxID=1913979 RepID=UPI0024C85399|nr:hypothetical protein [Microcella sp.]UYN83772.1 MAG: hypothetical protein KIT89_00540 [Microcella sp.]